MDADAVGTAYSRRAEEYAHVLGTMEATARADRALIGGWADMLDRPPGSSCAGAQAGSARRGVRLLDVGCGPGHWTAWLHERLHGRGAGVCGIDPVPAFVEGARRRFPGVPFEVGRAEELCAVRGDTDERGSTGSAGGAGEPDGMSLPAWVDEPYEDREWGAQDGSRPACVDGILAWYSLIHTAPEAVPRILAEFSRALRPGGSVLIGFFEGPAREAFDHAVATAYFWPVGELANLLEEAGFAVEETHTRQDPGARPHGAIVAARM